MKRKVSETPCRVYVYGLPLGPKERGPVMEQIRAGHDYYNQLVELERARRNAVRLAIAEVGDIASLDAEIEPLATELEEIREELKRRSKAARHKVRDPELEARAKELAPLLKKLRDSRKELKAAAKNDAALQAKISAIQARHKQMWYACRASTKAWWGTYIRIEEAIQAAAKGKMDPRFKRWQGEGTLGVLLPHGITPDKLYSDSTQIHIDRLPDSYWFQRNGKPRPVSRYKNKSMLRFRIGSDEKKKPIWAEFPIRLDRPIPEDALIKNAFIKVISHGPPGPTTVENPNRSNERWHLGLVLEAPSFHVETKAPNRIAAIDIGWRQTKEGLRIGYLVDNTGHHEEFFLPKGFAERIAHADSLQAIRDRNLNEHRELLAKWVETNELPEEAYPQFNRVRLWYGDRLHRCVEQWRHFPGDNDIYDALVGWSRQDKHLHRWSAQVRAKAVLYRREVYRVIAARLARHYDLILMPGFNLSNIVRRAKPEEDRVTLEAAAHNRFLASPGTFRHIISVAAKKYGCGFRLEKPPKVCSRCGSQDDESHLENIYWTCKGCGAVWDCDYNQALNLLACYGPQQVAAE